MANGKELSYRLKNANETESKIWRYHHYNSRLDYTTKRAILFSTLRKVHKMASNSKQLHISAIAKCKEYIKLHYPVGILKYMCSIMARETANHIWLQVRRELWVRDNSNLDWVRGNATVQRPVEHTVVWATNLGWNLTGPAIAGLGLVMEPGRIFRFKRNIVPLLSRGLTTCVSCIVWWFVWPRNWQFFPLP